MAVNEIATEEVFFKWSDEYSVNIRAIDLQHQELVNIINRLFNAIAMREGDKVIGSILDALLSYTKTHFSLEERLLLQAKYADYAAHKQEHVELIAQLDELCRKHMSDDKPIYFDMLRFLKKWLKEHINGEDKKYSRSLQEAGFSFADWERESAAEFSALMEKTGRWWKLW